MDAMNVNGIVGLVGIILVAVAAGLASGWLIGLALGLGLCLILSAFLRSMDVARDNLLVVHNNLMEEITRGKN